MSVFYRKYRPQKFSDLVGQDHVVKTLLLQLTSGKIGHGYLFAGPKGTGKTSCARIFAKAVNCLVYGSRNRERSTVNRFGEPCNKCVLCLSVINGSHLDLIEIDAASNRLIEDVRDLREKIKLSPVSSRYKVYIIDEVHMLTKEAFNALLKTLEEPPLHAIFILCTTEPNKLPPTIISRVQRFNFKRASEKELILAIKKVAKSEGIQIDENAAASITQAADGSYRDAISLLDQISSSKKQITEKDVANLVIFSDWDSIYSFAQSIADGDLKKAVITVENIWKAQADVSVFTKEAILFLEKLLFLKINIQEDILDLDEDQIAKMSFLASKLAIENLQNLMKLFLIAEGEMRIYPLPHISLILAICKYSLPKTQLIAESGINSEEDPKKHKENNLSNDRNKKMTQQPRGSKKPTKSVAKIIKLWPNFLSKVRPINTHVTAILRSARPVDFDGANLTLEVFYRFHKEKLEEPKIANVLDEILKETIGVPVRMKFILSKNKSSLPESIKASDVVEVKEVDLERVAAEIFSK